MNKQQKMLEPLIDEPTLLAIVKINHDKIPYLKLTKKLKVKGATLRTLTKITALLSSIDIKDDFYKSISNNADIPAKFLALAIHNKPSPPPDWLTKTLMDDFNTKQIQDMVNVAYGRIGIEDFFPIMVSLTKASLMPINTQEANQSKA